MSEVETKSKHSLSDFMFGLMIFLAVSILFVWAIIGIQHQIVMNKLEEREKIHQIERIMETDLLIKNNIRWLDSMRTAVGK
jgi:hypothetical protein